MNASEKIDLAKELLYSHTILSNPIFYTAYQVKEATRICEEMNVSVDNLVAKARDLLTEATR